jgi:hypothetical protein
MQTRPVSVPMRDFEVGEPCGDIPSPKRPTQLLAYPDSLKIGHLSHTLEDSSRLLLSRCVREEGAEMMWWCDECLQERGEKKSEVGHKVKLIRHELVILSDCPSSKRIS